MFFFPLQLFNKDGTIDPPKWSALHTSMTTAVQVQIFLRRNYVRIWIPNTFSHPIVEKIGRQNNVEKKEKSDRHRLDSPLSNFELVHRSQRIQKSHIPMIQTEGTANTKIIFFKNLKEWKNPSFKKRSDERRTQRAEIESWPKKSSIDGTKNLQIKIADSEELHRHPKSKPPEREKRCSNRRNRNEILESPRWISCPSIIYR